MSSISLDQFFVLNVPVATPGVWIWLDFSRRICELGREPEVRIIRETLGDEEGPVPFKVAKGRQVPIVWGNSAGIAIWSGSLVRALTAAGCTGIHSLPVVIYNRDDESLFETDVVWLRPSVGAGPQDDTRGLALLFTDYWKRDPTLKDAVGIHFDTATWSGLDVFRLPNHRVVLLSERAARIVQRVGAQGYEMESAADYGKALRDHDVALITKRGARIVGA